MAEQYVVYVAAPSEEPSPEARRRLAELLGLDPQKLDSLLRRLPGVVTKPIPEGTAVTVARRFREAGLDASIRSPGFLDAATAAPPPVGPPLTHDEQTAGPAEPAVERDPGEIARSDDGKQPNIWKTQFDSRPQREERVETEEDELFPRSSFAPPDGPKAPSRGLLVALLLVIVLLAALWYFL